MHASSSLKLTMKTKTKEETKIISALGGFHLCCSTSSVNALKLENALANMDVSVSYPSKIFTWVSKHIRFMSAIVCGIVGRTLLLLSNLFSNLSYYICRTSAFQANDKEIVHMMGGFKPILELQVGQEYKLDGICNIGIAAYCTGKSNPVRI